MVALEQIADMLGVSPTIVSSVINGRTGKTSTETRQRIEEVLWQNRHETSLKTNSSTSEETLVAAAFYMDGCRNVLMDSFYGELFGAIEQELRASGYRLVYDVPNEHKDEDLYRFFSPWNVRGGIFLGYEPDKCRALWRRTSKPFASIDSYSGDGKGSCDSIELQDYEDACEMTSYLLKLGHRSIAFFCDQRPPVASSGEHFRGLCGTLAGSRVIFSGEDYYFLPSDRNLRSEVLRQFARKSGKRYTAMFFISDFYTNENINTFFSQRPHMPDESSVTEFDDNIYVRLSRPMLTTIR